MRRLLIACLVAIPVFAVAQTPSPPPPERQAEPAAAPALPVRRVILYKTGVGYFEHLGNVRNRQSITIRFTSAQLNDVLNSLTVLDLGKGQITGISYNSVAPLEQRLGALAPAARREHHAGTDAGFASRSASRGDLRRWRRRRAGCSASSSGRANAVTTTIPTDTISVVTDGGELRTFELSPTVRVRIIERDLRQEIGRYLDLVGSTRAAGRAKHGDFHRRHRRASALRQLRQRGADLEEHLPAGVERQGASRCCRAGPSLTTRLAKIGANVELSLGGWRASVLHPEHLAAVLRAVARSCRCRPRCCWLRKPIRRSLGDGAGSVRGTVRDRAGGVDSGRDRASSMGTSGVVASGVSGKRRTVRSDRAGRRSTRSRFELTGFAPQRLRKLARAVRHTGPTGRDHGDRRTSENR